MKILINTPSINHNGGVANYYKGLKTHWTEEVNYNFIGGRNGVPGSLILFYDIIKFIIKIIYLKPEVILLNPSLGKTAIKRDGIFLRIGDIFKIPTIVFFRGWNQQLANKISKAPSKFVKLYNRADKILVLATSFKNQLIGWGITRDIELTTTKVNDSLIDNFNILEKKYNHTILFLARIEKEKGIFTTIEAFKEIKQENSKAKLIVAGNGGELDEAKVLVKELGIKDVKFTGYIEGQELVRAFERASILLFPTTHGEGMPNSVLEAMAFGLNIISRPVGGLNDFFENGKMGYLIDSTNPSDFSKKIIQLFKNKVTLKERGYYNYEYAKNNFYASNVAKEIENKCRSLIKK